MPGALARPGRLRMYHLQSRATATGCRRSAARLVITRPVVLGVPRPHRVRDPFEAGGRGSLYFGNRQPVVRELVTRADTAASDRRGRRNAAAGRRVELRRAAGQRRQHGRDCRRGRGRHSSHRQEGSDRQVRTAGRRPGRRDEARAASGRLGRAPVPLRACRTPPVRAHLARKGQRRTWPLRGPRLPSEPALSAFASRHARRSSGPIRA